MNQLLLQPKTELYKLHAGRNGELQLDLLHNWQIAAGRPSVEQLEKEIFSQNVKNITVSGAQLEGYDSGLVAALLALSKICKSKNIELLFTKMPEGIDRLLNLAFVAGPKVDQKKIEHDNLLTKLGNATLRTYDKSVKVITFTGELSAAILKAVLRDARFQVADVWEQIQETGPRALGIVTLISTLVGLIFAFVGAIQLQQFGAQIYVANLVGIAMTREMGAVMVGIIMAGRTAAAFAAQLGTMQVNEEIDAFKTFSIQPMEFLVVPRVCALVVMMPLLCLYADLAGIIGGAVVSTAALNINTLQYFHQTYDAIAFGDIVVGVVKSFVFGILVASCGCYHGINSGRHAAAVGLAATQAVVSSIVCIVCADAVFAVLLNILEL